MRYLVAFRSHAEDPADETFVEAWAASMPAAIRDALRKAAPPHDWILARAVPWPRGARDLDAAIRKLAAGAP